MKCSESRVETLQIFNGCSAITLALKDEIDPFILREYYPPFAPEDFQSLKLLNGFKNRIFTIPCAHKENEYIYLYRFIHRGIKKIHMPQYSHVV